MLYAYFKKRNSLIRGKRNSGSASHNAVSRLGGVVASVFATGPKGRGFESSQGGGFLRAIKIRSTPSFGWEIKPEIPCRKIL
jgi:hypothetical protein